MTSFAVIVVSYNSSKTLKRCLESSMAQPRTKTIVLDNNSRDESNKIINSYKNSIIHIMSPSNLGFGGGNNIAAKRAKEEYLVFLNPDAILPNNFSRKVELIFKNNPKIGILGFRFKNSDGSLQRTCNTFPTMGSLLYENSGYHNIFPNSRAFNDYTISNWDRNSSRYVDAVSGACFVMKKKDFQKIGGFDERFFLFFEEFDLAKRVLKINKRVFFESSIVIEHIGGVSMGSNGKVKTDKYMKSSQKTYIKKYYGNFYWLTFKILQKFFNLLSKLLVKPHSLVQR